jgi:hypothetical protein
MVAEAFAAVSALKAAFDIAKTLKDMNDAVARNAAVIELQGQILAAQEAQSTLTERIRELEKEVVGFKAWEAEEQRYELKSLGWGAFAQVLKPEVRGGKPPHWVCTNCYSQRRISIIQNAMIRGVGMRWHCPACKTETTPSQDMYAAGMPKWPD